MPNLVAFLDILGTTEMVSKNQFTDLVSLDFANPVGVAARFCPNLRFAVFSDSVIISSISRDAEQFLKALAFLYGQWFADYILVRGAVARGEVRWVDQPEVDEA